MPPTPADVEPPRPGAEHDQHRVHPDHAPRAAVHDVRRRQPPVREPATRSPSSCPPEYEGVIKYVDIDGRTKLAIRDKISDYIPNPTFGKVAVPGGAGHGRHQGRRAGSTAPGAGAASGRWWRCRHRRLLRPRAAPAAHEGDGHRPHAAVADARQRRSRSAWPTIPTSRVRRDPRARTSGCTSTGPTCTPTPSTPRRSSASPPATTAPSTSSSTSHERGAKIFLIRVAPVPTWKGRKSFALPEFDPFWERVAGARPRRRHALGRLRLHPLHQRVGRPRRPEMAITATSPRTRSSPAFLALSSEKDNLVDAMASIIGHGLATRFPKLRFMPVEFAELWIRPVLREAAAHLRRARRCSSTRTRSRCSTATCGCTPSTSPTRKGLIDLGIPVDHIMFGSDFPHPEGMGDPLAYSEVVADLPARPAGAHHGRLAREGDEGRASTPDRAPQSGRKYIQRLQRLRERALRSAG